MQRSSQESTLPKEAVEAVTQAMSWHPSETGPSYWETRRAVEAKLCAALTPAPALPGEEIGRVLRYVLEEKASDGWSADAWAVSVDDAFDCVMEVVAALLSRQPAPGWWALCRPVAAGNRPHARR